MNGTYGTVNFTSIAVTSDRIYSSWIANNTYNPGFTTYNRSLQSQSSESTLIQNNIPTELRSPQNINVIDTNLHILDSSSDHVYVIRISDGVRQEPLEYDVSNSRDINMAPRGQYMYIGGGSFSVGIDIRSLDALHVHSGELHFWESDGTVWSELASGTSFEIIP